MNGDCRDTSGGDASDVPSDDLGLTQRPSTYKDGRILNHKFWRHWPEEISMDDWL